MVRRRSLPKNWPFAIPSSELKVLTHTYFSQSEMFLLFAETGGHLAIKAESEI
jgi:hypothetical protein